jgi:DNA-binding PadR family transcriptional regulator
VPRTTPLRARKISGWSQGVLVGRDLCDDEPRPTTLVDFRGSNLSDAGSIPAISTIKNPALLPDFCINSLLDYYIRNGYSLAMATEPNILTPAVFHILLALSGGECHGYGIMKQVETDSQGRVSMGPGTLYGSLKRMLDAGLVKECDKRVDPEMDDERRIYYQITGVGAQALASELERYKRIVTLALERNLYPKTFAYGV